MAQIGAGTRRQLKMCQHRALRAEHPGLRFVERVGAGGRAHPGEPSRHLGGVEHLMVDVPVTSAREAAVEDPRAGTSEEEPTRAAQQRLADIGAEPLPQLVGPAQQRHIAGALEVGLPHDPRLAVTGAEVVCRRVAVEPEHPKAAARQVVGSGAPEPTKARDRDVVRRHGVQPVRCRSTA